jgi:hypothetical protein
MSEIEILEINLVERTIEGIDGEGTLIRFPLSPKGGTEIKYTKVSAGGHLVQALALLVEQVRREGGGGV